MSDREALAEALDDMISERGVTLDDDRLDWLAAFVAASQAAALREAAAAFCTCRGCFGGHAFDYECPAPALMERADAIAPEAQR